VNNREGKRMDWEFSKRKKVRDREAEGVRERVAVFVIVTSSASLSRTFFRFENSQSILLPSLLFTIFAIFFVVIF